VEHVNLGRTGLVVSRLCLGTMTFGLQCDEAASVAVTDAAAEGGFSFLDTCDVYPLDGDLSNVGRTEEIVGRWLAGRREQFVVATKCVGRMSLRPRDRGMSRKHVLDAVDGSLRRLRTDYVDLYQLHFYDDTAPLDEALEPYKPLAGGFLTGKYERSAQPTEVGTFTQGRAGDMYQEWYWHPAAFDAVERLREIAKTSGMSLATLAVAWVLANPAVTSAIIGASQPEQLADGFTAADQPLHTALKKSLDEATTEWRKGDAPR
jgi:aryl-alcohol dehydrogenase-like predicted oxidoreductase